MGSPLFSQGPLGSGPPHLWSPWREGPFGSPGSHVGARSLCDVAVPWLSSWWFFTNPFEKICKRQIGTHFPEGSGVKIQKWLKPPPGYGVVCSKAVSFFVVFVRTRWCATFDLPPFGCLFGAAWNGWKHKKTKTSMFEGWPSRKWSHDPWVSMYQLHLFHNRKLETPFTIATSHLWRYHNDIQSSMFAHHQQGYLSQTSPEFFYRNKHHATSKFWSEICWLVPRLIHICVCDHVLLVALIIKTLPPLKVVVLLIATS